MPGRKKKAKKADEPTADFRDLAISGRFDPLLPDIPEKLTLKSLASGIALAALRAKIAIDAEAVRARKDVYEKDDILRALPLTTFDFSEIEVELRFAVEGVEGGDVVVSTDAEKLEKIRDSLSSVKLRLRSRPVMEYTLPGGERVLKE